MTLGVLVLVLLAAYLPLCAAARQLTASEVWADSSTLVVAAACAGVGLVVAWHQPRNLLGCAFIRHSAGVGFVRKNSSVLRWSAFRWRPRTWALSWRSI